MDADGGSGRKRPRSAVDASEEDGPCPNAGEEAQVDAGADAAPAKRRYTEVWPSASASLVRCPYAAFIHQAGEPPAAADAEVRWPLRTTHVLLGCSLGSVQAAAAAAAAAAPIPKPELLSPGTTIALSDVHDVILHALIDAVAPKWLRLQAR